MDLDNVVAMALFAEVVQQQSFSEAAKRVGIAKSAVSRRISELEARLGVRLLHRTTRRLALTEEGLRFYEQCAVVTAAAAQAEADAVSVGRKPRGTLRVSAPTAFSDMFFARTLSDFLGKYPDVAMELTTSDSFVDLVSEAVEVAIRVGQLEDSSLVARRLATDRLVVCAAPAYLDRHGTPRALDDLVRHTCLRYSLAVRHEWTLVAPDGPRAVPVRGNLLSNSGPSLREAAIGGLGLVVLPSFMVAPDVREGRLVVVLDDAHHTELVISAVYLHRKNVPQRLRVFVDYLVERFATAKWAKTHLLPA